MTILFYAIKYGFSYIASFLSGLLANFMSIIPDCPFEQFIEFEDNMDIIKYINYFIPFDNFLIILQGWLVFVIIYLAFRLVSGTIKDVPFIGSILNALFK